MRSTFRLPMTADARGYESPLAPIGAARVFFRLWRCRADGHRSRTPWEVESGVPPCTHDTPGCYTRARILHHQGHADRTIMAPELSVTRLIGMLKGGDGEA